MDKTIHYLYKQCWSSQNRLLVLAIIFSLAFFSNDTYGLRIIFIGDVLLSRNVREELSSEKCSPWYNLKPLLNSADLVIGNLEGAVGKPDEQSSFKNEAPVFDIDSSHISLLTEAGFDIITLENNHSNDLGKSGKKNTIKAIQKNQLSPVFFDNSPQFFTVKGVCIAVLTLNIVPGRELIITEIPSIELKQKLRLARSLADIVIVSVHWGSEFLDWPTTKQRKIARWLIKNGTDLIIGSHPHVIQQPEMIEGKPVFFSLGNHLFDQKFPATKKGLIVELYIHNGKMFYRGIITKAQQNSFFPKISGIMNFKLKALRFKSSGIKTKDFTIRPKSVFYMDQFRLVLEAFQSGKKKWSSRPKSIITAANSKLDDKHEYLFTLEKYYSKLDGEVNLRPYVYLIEDRGLIPKWRGSALAWPLLDALISLEDNTVLYALHRGDSFINLSQKVTSTRVAAYKWNGFGFSGISDSLICRSGRKAFFED
ncbi:MAG: CapA family protein [Candidatus Neomarinimicrobiota bacterium]